MITIAPPCPDAMPTSSTPIRPSESPRPEPLGRVAGARTWVRALSRGTIAYVLLTQAANATNYASNLVFSRQLGTVGFGELTSLLALALILAVPLGAAQTVVAERVALAHAAGDSERVAFLARHALGHVLTLGTVAGVVYLACIPLIISVLDIREPGPVIALAPFVVLNFVSTVATGVLQGMGRFTALGWLIFAAASSRLAFGLPWALAGGGAGGAIAGQSLGLLVVMVVVGWRFRSSWAPRGTSAAALGMRRRIDMRAFSASGAFIGFAILSNLDIVLSRLYLDGDDAGVYAALSTVGKLIIFLPAAISVLMVPRAAIAHAEDARDGAGVLRLAVGAALASTLLIAVPAVAFPGTLVDVMFGTGYEGARGGVLPMVLAGAGLATLYIICTYSVAIRDRRWLLLLAAGIVVQVVAIAGNNDSPVDIAWAQAATIGIVLTLNELAFHSLRPRRRPPST
jgi:O-antigen/teichoic acid export membrane protein